jgi:hypothetical protein
VNPAPEVGLMLLEAAAPFSAQHRSRLWRYLARTLEIGARAGNRYVDAWSQPGALAAQINYYRAALRRSPKEAEAMLKPVQAPTRVTWGEKVR